MPVRTVLMVVIVTCLLLAPGFTQSLEDLGSHGEYYLKFRIRQRSELERLTRLISIDNFRNDTIFAYVHTTEMDELRDMGYELLLLVHPGKRIVPRMSDAKGAMNWDSYPTYDAYVAMMQQFADDYPDLCRIDSIGSSEQGRALLFAKISDNVATDEAEPEFMYSSTMHGDEVVGYVLMLRLIDYLLSNYGIDEQVTRLVDSVEIWINPLANPDGTYRTGNHTTFDATRGNANGIDLNRNFPDPALGDHPDGNKWQPETIAMMKLATEHHFVMAANFHCGVEVVNYPWDCWSRLHADNDWYYTISRQYADTAHVYGKAEYMTYPSDDGVTNGYAWYEIHGGRQDYMNYFQRCRETTIEISGPKTPNPSEYWEYNRRSFLNYIGNVLEGIYGKVSDLSGNPVKAKISIVGHDFDNSEVFSGAELGDFYRMVLPGTYTLKIEAEGFISEIAENIIVLEGERTHIDVQLVPVAVVCDRGDVDGDGAINIYDVVKIINFILDKAVPTETEACAADWNMDNFIDQQDVDGIIEVILDE